jgi:hypothetical protein
MLTRYGLQLLGDPTPETVRLELMLEDASIKLSSVASSLNTVAARAMRTAMINGETNPLQLANLWKGRMRHKIPDRAQALSETFDAHHAQLAKSILRRPRVGRAGSGRAGCRHRRAPALAAPNRVVANLPSIPSTVVRSSVTTGSHLR